MVIANSNNCSNCSTHECVNRQWMFFSPRPYLCTSLTTNSSISILSLFIFYQNDFQIYASDRSQCFKCHGMFDFAYKLQLHYNIYRLVFTI